MSTRTAPRQQILIVVTSHARLGETGQPTGLWLDELAAPYLAFVDAGFDVTVASPAGGRAPVDPGSVTESFTTPAVTRFQADPGAQQHLASTLRIADLPDVESYAAILLAGGHGTMWDFFPNAQLGRLLADAERRGAVIATVCHGAAGLLNAEAASLVTRRTLTAFTDDEEDAVGLTDVVPFLVQRRLTEQGATVRAGQPFAVNVVQDGRLVTGQNPASALAVAEAVVSMLSAP